MILSEYNTSVLENALSCIIALMLGADCAYTEESFGRLEVTAIKSQSVSYVKP